MCARARAEFGKGIKVPALIFVQSKERAVELYHELKRDGVNVATMHGTLSPAQRTEMLTNFRIGKIWFLIATDLLSRGIDFKCVKSVINYDFPQSVSSYIHRIGRTGRAGREGEAHTFFTGSPLRALLVSAQLTLRS